MKISHSGTKLLTSPGNPCENIQTSDLPIITITLQDASREYSRNKCPKSVLGVGQNQRRPGPVNPGREASRADKSR